MKLTKAQKRELTVWEFFIPSHCDWAEKTDKDIEIFFEWSEQGKHKDVMQIMTYTLEGRTYAHALYWGKKWAGIHCHELWSKNDSLVPMREILAELPEEVGDFVIKEMQL